MTSADKYPRSGIREVIATVLRWFGSVQLAVALIVILAVVLALATILEADQGRAYAQWWVYYSPWFFALLALLGANILAATIIRYPWRKKVGFLITHAGLLALLAGSVQTFLGGIEGQIAIQEGQTTDRIVVTDLSRFVARWQRQPGESRSRPAGIFTFKPGPVDWPDGKTLDLGEVSDVGLKIVKFYNHAMNEEVYLEDPNKQAGPALLLGLLGSDDATISESWLATDQSNAQLNFGPIELRVLQATEDSMREDFLRPPAKDSDPDGILSMHYKGKMYRVPVSINLGKKVPVGDSGIEVEIKEYLPDAQPEPGVHFKSASKEPKNPPLELSVKLAKDQEAFRQIVFAKLPMLNLDAIHGRTCPVKFWYHHPAAKPRSGVEFFQTPDGKLACRTATPDGYQIKETVQIGDRVELTAGFKVALLKYLPHAIQEIRFHRQETRPGENRAAKSAALVEVAVGDSVQRVWLKRNDPELGQQMISTREGVLTLTFEYESLPLGFKMQLIKFTRGLNPGGMGNASFASKIRLLDPESGLDDTREISMNEPLTRGKYTFYQSSFQESPDSRPVSVLSVAYDPGLMLKYLGSLMICGGCAGMFLARSRWFNRSAKPNGKRQPEQSGDTPAAELSNTASASST